MRKLCAYFIGNKIISIGVFANGDLFNISCESEKGNASLFILFRST